MPDMLINILLLAGTFAAMEGVAVFSHKYVMHGFMWCWHESHHLPRKSIVDENDLFAAIFAVPSIVLIYLGTVGHPRLLWVGIGIAMYGLMYSIFHDVIVHRRIAIKYKAKNAYMRRIIEAHWVHHSTQGKAGAVSFGFLYSPAVDKLVLQRDRLQQELAVKQA